MKNIFIIGNGFDLAHGYKTDYTSFIDYLIIKEVENEKLFDSVLVRNKGEDIDPMRTVGSVIKYVIKEKDYYIRVSNQILKIILERTNINKWCDIEVLYYELLKTTKNPKKLNIELTKVKNELEKYLYQFNQEQNTIAEFSSFFEQVGKENKNLVVNFNYTNTFDRLYNKTKKFKVLDFHGQLNSEINPIIFGYAPTEEETKILIDENNNELLKNIKRYYYKQTNNENLLNDFIGKINNDYINVFVIGHSCGVSDRKILNEIFTNENVKNINIMYYKNYQGYFDTLVNIDRVIGKESHYGVIRNFELSLKSPKHNDVTENVNNFNEKLRNLINSIREDIKHSMPDTSF